MDNTRDRLMDRLRADLPFLRAKLGINQDDLAVKLGVSKSTISFIESGKRKLTWTMFLALVCFFRFNEETKRFLEYDEICSQELLDELTASSAAVRDTAIKTY